MIAIKTRPLPIAETGEEIETVDGNGNSFYGWEQCGIAASSTGYIMTSL
jgi:hypothetical protein